MAVERLAIGSEFTSPGRTIAESDLVTFAGLSGDFSELHTNEEYARTTQFGGRIAHGALVFSISVGLMTRMSATDGVIAFSGVDHLRFVRPVFIGDTIAVRKRLLLRRRVQTERDVLTFDTRVFNQQGEIVLAYVDKLLVARQLDSESDRSAVAHADESPQAIGHSRSARTRMSARLRC